MLKALGSSKYASRYSCAKSSLLRGRVDGKPDSLSAGKVRWPRYADVSPVVCDQIVDLAHLPALQKFPELWKTNLYDRSHCSKSEKFLAMGLLRKRPSFRS